MQQTDPSLQLTYLPTPTSAQLVQVGDTNYVQVNQRVYSITEIQPTAIQLNHPISVTSYPNGFWDSFKWLVMGLVGMGFFALFAYSIARMSSPTPAVTLIPAPTPQIIIQPPPEKKPFTRRDCRADCLFGWSQTCTEERGYE